MNYQIECPHCKKYLTESQKDQMDKIINKYDYWNKMKELDDLVS